MKSFKQFLEEGKKSKLKSQLMHHYLTQQSLKPSPPPQNFGVGTAPNSSERNAAIAQMMKVQGGAAVIKAAEKRKKAAKKYAEKVLKNKIPNPL